MSNINPAMNNSFNMIMSEASTANSLNKLAGLKVEKINQVEGNNISQKRMGEIEAAAKDFEAVFISEMMKPIFQTVKTNETFGGGRGEDVFKGMMVQEYGKAMVENGGVGITEQVKAQLIRIQENSQ